MRRLANVLLATAIGLAAVGACGAEPVRILTWNLGLLEVLGADYVPLVRERERLVAAELAGRLAAERPDIVLLQEAWRPRHVRAIAAAAVPLGYAVTRPRGASMLGLAGGGLLLLLREPLEVVSWRFARFRKSTFIDSLVRKGVLEATIRDPRSGTLLALVGTHTVALDTVDGEPADPGQLAAFLAQAEEIVAALDRRSEGGAVPAILLGDLNVGPGYVDAAYRRIAGLPGMVEAGAAVGAEDALVSWDPANPLVARGRYPREPAAKIDHVFLRGGQGASWTVTRVSLVGREPVDGLELPGDGSAAPMGVPLSDHYGLLVEAVLARR